MLLLTTCYFKLTCYSIDYSNKLAFRFLPRLHVLSTERFFRLRSTIICLGFTIIIELK